MDPNDLFNMNEEEFANAMRCHLNLNFDTDSESDKETEDNELKFQTNRPPPYRIDRESLINSNTNRVMRNSLIQNNVTNSLYNNNNSYTDVLSNNTQKSKPADCEQNSSSNLLSVTSQFDNSITELKNFQSANVYTFPVLASTSCNKNEIKVNKGHKVSGLADKPRKTKKANVTKSKQKKDITFESKNAYSLLSHGMSSESESESETKEIDQPKDQTEIKKQSNKNVNKKVPKPKSDNEFDVEICGHKDRKKRNKNKSKSVDKKKGKSEPRSFKSTYVRTGCSKVAPLDMYILSTSFRLANIDYTYDKKKHF